MNSFILKENTKQRQELLLSHTWNLELNGEEGTASSCTTTHFFWCRTDLPTCPHGATVSHPHGCRRIPVQSTVLTSSSVGATEWSGCCGWRNRYDRDCPPSLPSPGAAEGEGAPPGAERPSRSSPRPPSHAGEENQMKIIEVGPLDGRKNNHGALWILLPCSLAFWLFQWLHAPHVKKFPKRVKKKKNQF